VIKRDYKCKLFIMIPYSKFSIYLKNHFRYSLEKVIFNKIHLDLFLIANIYDSLYSNIFLDFFDKIKN